MRVRDGVVVFRQHLYPFSLCKIIEKYPSPTLFKQVTTGELQGEVKSLKRK